MAVETSVVDGRRVGEYAPAASVDDLVRFRAEFYDCLTARADALFELTEAVLCADGPVTTLVELCLAGVHRRGHGALYDGLNAGQVEFARLRRTLAGVPLPRDREGRIMLAVDVSNWLRSDAETSSERLFCHTYGRGKGHAQMIPGWPYSFVAALETGRTSWTAILDGQRLRPGHDETTVTAGQVRDVVTRLIDAGQWRDGDPAIVIVLDAGYDITRLAFLLADLPVEMVGRLRSDRVLRFPAPAARRDGRPGRPPKHGAEFRLADPASWPAAQVATSTETSRYGTATAQAWDRLHPRLTHRSAWAGHDGTLPIIAGTLIRLTVEHLPGDRDPKPVWLWCSTTGASPADVDRVWQVFLRRFDIEHTFRMLKQTLGWTAPRIRDPQAADRWTWIIIAAYAQLRLARRLTDDLRRPWERHSAPRRLTPARVRRGYRNLHRKLPTPARAPKPSRPGPGRPPGSKNRHRAPRYNVGKHTKTDIKD